MLGSRQFLPFFAISLLLASALVFIPASAASSLSITVDADHNEYSFASVNGTASFVVTITNDGDDDLNYFMGIDIEFNPELSLLMEYNAALNENDMTAKNIAINKGGYLNAAIRWTFVERLHIELDFNNLLFDEDRVDYFNRELKITYIEYF